MCKVRCIILHFSNKLQFLRKEIFKTMKANLIYNMNVHIRLSYISKILICMKSIDEKKIIWYPQYLSSIASVLVKNTSTGNSKNNCNVLEKRYTQGQTCVEKLGGKGVISIFITKNNQILHINRCFMRFEIAMKCLLVNEQKWCLPKVINGRTFQFVL